MKTTVIKLPPDLCAELDALAKRDYWTPEKDAILRAYAGRVSNAQIAAVLSKRYGAIGRSAVQQRVAKLMIRRTP